MESGAEHQRSPEQVGYDRLELIGMTDYADRQVFDGEGNPKFDEQGQPISLVSFFGTYDDHGVPGILETVASPETSDEQRATLVGGLQFAARFYTGER